MSDGRQYTDFEIGLEFECGRQRWCCTDVGTRTVIAIALEHPEDPSGYKGPPYAVAEAVFDEYDISACIDKTLDSKERINDEGASVSCAEFSQH